MLKSHVGDFVRVYEALFEDIVYAAPHLRAELERDLDRLRRTAVTRGIHLFVVDLPLIGKHFDKCLSKGMYSPPNLPLTSCRPGGVVIPKFLGGLYLHIFGKDGKLKGDLNAEFILFIRQILYLAKKVELPFSPKSLDLAVKSLFDEDHLLPRPERFWNEDSPSTCSARVTFPGFARSRHYSSRIGGDVSFETMSKVLRCLDFVSGFVCRSLGHYVPSDWSFRHGPGAISQIVGTTNKYHWYGWSQRLESVFPIADCGFHSFSSWADLGHLIDSPTYVGKSRLVAVPKTYEKPRLIAAEPSENQWCQQNIWHFMKSRTKETLLGQFIRFTDQSLNQELCRQGSRDGTLATIDLSSASDRVSCHAVGNLFRQNLSVLDALRSTRTLEMSQSISDKSPSTLSLRKFSTMGSAVTFPVESLMFLAVSLSVVLVKEHRDWDVENIKALIGRVGVFGDDIIVPNESRSLLQSTLEVLDFKVNEGKSFSEGFFRESCGVDCYKGEYVTPVYWHGRCGNSPESVASTVETANNFYSLFFLRTAQYLESTLPSQIATARSGSGVFGLRSRVGTSRHPSRWNAALQRTELRIRTLSTRSKVEPSDDDSSLHQYFTEDPGPLSKWMAGVRKKPRSFLDTRWVAASELVTN